MRVRIEDAKLHDLQPDLLAKQTTERNQQRKPIQATPEMQQIASIIFVDRQVILRNNTHNYEKKDQWGYRDKAQGKAVIRQQQTNRSGSY